MFVAEISAVRIIYAVMIFAFFLLFKNLISKTIIKLFKKISEKYSFKTMAILVESFEGPIKNFLLYTGTYCALSILPLKPDILFFIYKIYRTCIIISVTQSLLNVMTAYALFLNSNVINQEGRPLVFKTLFPMLYKAIKVLVIILCVVIIAAEFDFEQLSSILAGIGIGGAAIALASQDLIKNFFGGLVVLTDKSFHVGDFISVDSNEGIVEELGFRSTKIRTLEQEIIVVPNSKFTDTAVINYTKRNLRRVSFRVGVKYDTPSDQLMILIDQIKKMLEEEPMVDENTALVKFDKFGANSLEILVQYMVKTSEYNLYMDIKDKINFKIMGIFERDGIEFAFPSMSIYLEKND